MIRLIFTVLAILAAAPAYAQSNEQRVNEAAARRDAFWQALEAEDYAGAYAVMTDGFHALETAESFATNAARLRQQLGPVIERRVMRTTVYDNPPNAPAPGVYIAFDLVARFERADRYCGYVILHQAAEGAPFRVTRVDQAIMENSVVAGWNGAGQSPDQVWLQMTAQFCPGWQPSWAIAPPV